MNNFKMDILQNPSKKGYILGLSGGVDSMALLTLLVEAEIDFKAVYVNHGLRTEAAEEAQFLGAYCEALGIDFESRLIDVEGYRKATKESVEEAGRNLRYGVLFEIAEAEKRGGVLVAHHFDDQAESILMHLLRGSGLDGLSGMQAWTLPCSFHATIPLIRPLLGVPKEELVAFCVERDVPFFEDESNQDVTFRRNLIRHSILPVLEEFNPKVREKLVQLGKIAQDESDLIAELVDDIDEDVYHYYDLAVPLIEINREQFLTLHSALQKRLIRRMVKRLKPTSRNIGYVTICAIQEAIGGDFTTNRLYFEDHLLLVFNHGVCFLSEKADAMAQVYYPQLSEPLKLAVEDQHVALSLYDRLVMEEVNYETFLARDVDDSMCAYLAADDLDSIVVSTKKAGDRIRMFGFGGQSKKISTLLIDLKVHREARERYPIFRDGEGRIIWVPGYKISIDYPVQKTSKRIFRLCLCKQMINNI